MKSRLLALVAPLVPLFAGADEAAHSCAFNQPAIEKQLAARASRSPGAAFDPGSNAYNWRLPSGAVVTLTHGGCEDLATTVTVTGPVDRTWSKAEAVGQLTKAVSRYWSVQVAREFQIAWRNGKFIERSTSAGAVQYSVQSAKGFAFGATVSISPSAVSLGWVEL